MATRPTLVLLVLLLSTALSSWVACSTQKRAQEIEPQAEDEQSPPREDVEAASKSAKASDDGEATSEEEEDVTPSVQAAHHVEIEIGVVALDGETVVEVDTVGETPEFDSNESDGLQVPGLEERLEDNCSADDALERTVHIEAHPLVAMDVVTAVYYVLSAKCYPFVVTFMGERLAIDQEANARKDGYRVIVRDDAIYPHQSRIFRRGLDCNALGECEASTPSPVEMLEGVNSKALREDPAAAAALLGKIRDAYDYSATYAYFARMAQRHPEKRHVRVDLSDPLPVGIIPTLFDAIRCKRPKDSYESNAEFDASSCQTTPEGEEATLIESVTLTNVVR